MDKMNNTENFQEWFDHGDHLDEDGYPTEATLKTISEWDYNDVEGCFEFIKSIWRFKDMGYWREGESIDELTNKKGYCYYISTAGWSGNESIIHALRENEIIWSLTWAQSRRGGHYIFELR